jgi:cytochrome c-type protein NapB
MKKLLISSAAVALLFVGCNQNPSSNEVKNQTVEVTGIRKAGLEKGSQNLAKIEYTKQAPVPGQVKPFKKSFVTAPPMIPHSVNGMVPIKIGSNACLSCHMPQNAKGMGITAIPSDHFVDNFEGDKKRQRIAGSRYNCTQCHAPQATLDPVIENRFESIQNAKLAK